MKIGDLVKKPASNRPYGLVGVIVDTTTRIHEGLVGVNWPDVKDNIVYEPSLQLEVIG